MGGDRARLEDLAARLLDGRADFDREISVARDADERSAIEYLRVLGDIAAVYGTARGDPLAGGPGEPQPQRWGHLRILERIGAGSSGEVFRAWDESLDREVALKLLRGSDDGAIEEGRMLARVRHPHFVAVYGAARHDGRVGIWMECLRGRTLAAILKQDGPFSAREAAAIGADVCQALAAVHRAGLLHRDIKAGNVIREVGGRVVVMDLGAAQEASGRRASLQGTLPYIAPEVLAGAATTAAADIYSTGVLLFHLVTGTYPYAGRSVLDLAAAHARPRPLLRDVRPGLPKAFTAAVERAIAIDPSRRFATAGAFEDALQGATVSFARAATPRRVFAVAAVATAVLVAAGAAWWKLWRAAAPGGAVTSLAVLPFVETTADDRSQYVAEGVGSELIERLSGRSDLRVISRSSSEYYRTHPTPLADVARDLHVDGVVEGTLTRRSGDVRIDVRLIDPRTEQRLWRQTVQARTLPLAEADLARAVATALARPKAADGRMVSSEGFDFYLQGQYRLARRTPEGLQAARALFDRALERDPEYAPAHAGLAVTYTLLGAFGVTPRADAFPPARRAAENALRLDENNSLAHAVLGYVFWEQGNQGAAATRELQEAIRLDPNDVTALQWYALTRASNGHYEEAISTIERARAIDPLSMTVASDAGRIYQLAGKLGEARAALQKLAALYPDFAEGHRMLGMTDADMDHTGEAQSELTKAIQIAGPTDYLLGELGWVQGLRGERDAARATLARLVSRQPRVDATYDAIIMVAGALGDVPLVVKWINSCRTTGYRACGSTLDNQGLERVNADPRVRAARRQRD